MIHVIDEHEMVRLLKKGDIRGLEILVTRYQVKATRVAFLVTHDEQTAEDVVQDVFVRVFHSIHQFDDARPFEPYLMRIVLNASVKSLKKVSKWLPFEDCSDDEIKDLLVQAADVEDQVEFKELKIKIVEALAKLHPRERAVIVQRYYLEMSEKEMAEALAVAPGTIKWLLNIARERLRALLGSERSAK